MNNEKTGEQAFTITDGDPRVQNPSEVNNVTVLYQGSTSPDRVVKQPGEVKRDWWDNNKKIASNILKGYNNPKAEFEPTGQMKSSGKTLNNAMEKYKNARFDVYGHSQASSNAQYALGSLDSQDKLDRVNGAFLYQGPNAYVMMFKEQRERVKQ